ncbi:hypothetical protein OYC64_021924 [Pagothenia borchgrevinki]|uniref:Uncharacterized protein n=1 Tax=Pagothenia borchgrevinki TaxID=8213 RepID=A0ABD2G1L0_PAGBO
MAKTGSERKLFSSRQRLSNPDDELAVIENGESRASLCEDISERALSSDSHRNSFTGSGAIARVHPEVERRDSFLDRFRGPELKETSRESNAQSLGSCDVARKRNLAIKWPLATYNMNNCNNTDNKKEEKKEEIKKDDEKKDGDKKDDEKKDGDKKDDEKKDGDKKEEEKKDETRRKTRRKTRKRMIRRMRRRKKSHRKIPG